MRAFRPWFLAFVLALALAGRAVPVNVIATGDMHGWLEPHATDERTLGGAAEMLAHWKRVEGYVPERFLLISCGDTATGPALATVMKNDPVIAVMNLMGYDVNVMGNHEFDCGPTKLAEWRKDAQFPFITANMAKNDGTPADFAPYLLYEEQGVKVAVIGLTTGDVGIIANTGGLVGTSYADALKKWVPEARAKGAQAVIVAAHVPINQLVALAKQVEGLRIPLMLGGHSHELGQMKVGDTWVVNSGEWWRAYSRITLDVDPRTGKTVVLSANQVWLQQPGTAPADPAVQAEIARWKAKMDREFNAEIGYTATGITRPTGVYNFITDCWMARLPGADLALSNNGGFRQDIPAGPITRAAIIGVMPFNNALVRVKLTGAQLLAYLPGDGGFIGMSGLKRHGALYTITKTGRAVDPLGTYQVLMNDYMYNASAHLKAADPNPALVAEDWRQPVYDWLTAHPTNRNQPLEAAIDQVSRVN